jgi:hypothetical protein
MKRILDKNGVRKELDGGGWFNLLPQVGNLRFGEKLRRLSEEKRAELGLPVDANLVDAIGLYAYSEIHARAMVGTVVMGWGDFGEPDGGDLQCRRHDGTLDEDAAVEIILFPGVGDDLAKALKSLDERAVKDQEIATGNSPEPSDGSSATVGS